MSDINKFLLGSTRGNSLALVKYSVENDADVNAKDCDGDTALDIALDNGYTEIADYLKSLNENYPTVYSLEEFNEMLSKREEKK